MQLEEICGFLVPNGSIPYGIRAGVEPRMQKVLVPLWFQWFQFGSNGSNLVPNTKIATIDVISGGEGLWLIW